MQSAAFEKLLRRRKPQASQRIDWSHPITRDLAGCWLFNDGGGTTAREIVAGYDGTLTNTPTIGYWGDPLTGYAVTTNGSSSYVIASNFPSSYWAAPLSVAVWGSFSRVGTTSSMVGSYTTAGGAGFSFKFEQWNTTNQVGVSFPGVNDYASGIACPSGMTLFVWTMLSNSSSIIYVMNPSTVTSASISTGTPNAPNSNGLVIGAVQGSSSGISDYASGTFSSVMFWRRVLGASEVLQLYADPFCFMRPLPLWPMNVTAAAATQHNKLWGKLGMKMVGRL